MLENDLHASEEEEDFYEHYRIVADRGQSLMRLDQYLKHHIANATRTKIQNAIETESVKVNDKVVKSSYKVKPFDVITVSMPYPPRETDIVPEDIPLNIVYEDEEVMVLNKPAGMVVHPAYGHWSGTVVNALVYHFQHLPTHRNGEIRPGLVHRIDKDTSGLLVIAKTEFGMAFLAKQFFDHSIERTYYALVWGSPKNPQGTITGHIGRSIRDRKVMAVYADGSQGKHAVTHYETLESFGNVSLIKCNLETGRTHQIRAHLQYLGHPLFSDAVYGGDKILRGPASGSYKAFVENCFTLMPRQALHAKSIGFVHPRTKQWMQFESALPEDFEGVLAKWRSYAER
ncbi:MAG: RluA family pseudouridine synthase [Spirosomaceae bacterium]|jgi:23S rRNA pseudouridine1911/1915/1917 synthase|nr:RluA family pseudouridine synthase [Spirosomataceae bacterium]